MVLEKVIMRESFQKIKCKLCAGSVLLFCYFTIYLVSYGSCLETGLLIGHWTPHCVNLGKQVTVFLMALVFFCLTPSV